METQIAPREPKTAAMAAVSVRYVIPPRRRPVEPENPSVGLTLAPYSTRPESIDANRINPSGRGKFVQVRRKKK